MGSVLVRRARSDRRCASKPRFGLPPICGAVTSRAYSRSCVVAARKRPARFSSASCRLDGTSDLFGPAPQSVSTLRSGGRAFTPSLAGRSAPDADVEAYLARQMKFDPDVWISKIEDRAGRNFLDIIAG